MSSVSKILLLSFSLLLSLPLSAAHGQQAVSPCTRVANPQTGAASCDPVSASAPLPVSLATSAPAGSTPLTGNATGTTGAVVGTLSSATGKTAFICGFSVSAIGGTASVGPITVAGLLGSSMVFQLASSATGSTLAQNFSPCVAASAAAQDITVTTTADGTASAVSVNSWGFRQ